MAISRVPFPWITKLDPVAQREIEKDFQWITDNMGAATNAPFLLIAASNATAWEKLTAVVVCPGTDDTATIQAVLDSVAGTTAVVALSSGQFIVTGTLNVDNAVFTGTYGQASTSFIKFQTGAGTYTSNASGRKIAFNVGYRNNGNEMFRNLFIVNTVTNVVLWACSAASLSVEDVLISTSVGTTYMVDNATPQLIFRNVWMDNTAAAGLAPTTATIDRSYLTNVVFTNAPTGVPTITNSIIVAAKAAVNGSLPWTYTDGGGNIAVNGGQTGLAVLVAGTKLVTPGVILTAAARIKLYYNTPGGAPGAVFVTAVTPTTFTITSTSGADTSTIAWEILPQ